MKFYWIYILLIVLIGSFCCLLACSENDNESTDSSNNDDDDSADDDATDDDSADDDSDSGEWTILFEDDFEDGAIKWDSNSASLGAVQPDKTGLSSITFGEWWDGEWPGWVRGDAETQQVFTLTEFTMATLSFDYYFDFSSIRFENWGSWIFVWAFDNDFVYTAIDDLWDYEEPEGENGNGHIEIDLSAFCGWAEESILMFSLEFCIGSETYGEGYMVIDNVKLRAK